MKNFLNSIKKQGRKSKELINKKPLKLNKKTKKKIIIYYFYKKPLKSS